MTKLISKEEIKTIETIKELLFAELESKNTNYRISDIKKLNNLYMVVYEGENKETNKKCSIGFKTYDSNKNEFIRLSTNKKGSELLHALKLMPTIYSDDILKFEYIGHNFISDNTCITLHDIKEDGTFIFTVRNIIQKTSPKLNKGKFDVGNVATPKKVYETSKGLYVNIFGTRFYLNDLHINYSGIFKYID